MHKLRNQHVSIGSSERSKKLLCFVHGQGQKNEQKPTANNLPLNADISGTSDSRKHVCVRRLTTKNFVVFHNHSPLLTMHRSDQIFVYMYLYSCCHSMLNWIPRIKRTNTRDVWLNQEERDLSCTDCWLTNMALSPNERRELTMRDNALFFKRWHFYLRTESTLYELKPCVSLYL